MGATAYGVATRAWPLAICGQIFLLVSGAQLVTRMLSNRPEWYSPLAPIAALGLLSFATWQWFALKAESNPSVRDPLLQLAMIYRWVALVMSLWWVCEYIHERERVWVFVLFGCGVVSREKMYRWAGLGILAAALGRVIVIDVWTLDRIYRVLSFMALGIVLLVLGFIYNKYQEKIRQWL